MRVLVASGPIGDIGGAAASSMIATAFANEGTQVAVIDLDPCIPTAKDIAQLADVLDGAATVIDLRGFGFHSDDADVLREAIAGKSFLAVVPDDVVDATLCGLGGTVVRATREAGKDLGAGLNADRAARAWLDAQGLDDGDGAGALGGAGAVLLASGIRLSAWLPMAMERTGFAQTAVAADLVVTGCTDLDFLTRGGPLVQAVVAAGEAALRPVIVVAARNYVSDRELRLASIEAAYPVLSPGEQSVVEPEMLAAVAARVARTWRF